MALLASKHFAERFDEMRLGTQQHPPHEVGRGNIRSPLEDEKSTGSFYVTVAVLAITVGCDIIAVCYVPAAIVRDPSQ